MLSMATTEKNDHSKFPKPVCVLHIALVQFRVYASAVNRIGTLHFDLFAAQSSNEITTFFSSGGITLSSFSPFNAGNSSMALSIILRAF